MGVLFVFASVWSGGVLWLLYEFCVCSACGYAGRGGPCAGALARAWWGGDIQLRYTSGSGGGAVATGGGAN